MAARNPANPYNAGIDANNYPTLTALSGTAGTADTAGTAEIFALGGNPTTGALYVHDLSGASGTTTVQMASGTLNVGTVVVSSSSGGTNVNVVTGTQQLLTTLSNLTNGTVRVSVGTVGGGAASGAAASGNPILMGGTDGGGTVYVPVVNTAGNLLVQIVNAPAVVVNSGTQQTLGTVGVVNNLVTGTLAAVSSVSEIVKGTTTLVSTVTTVSNLTNGSVNILTGTLQSSGTTTGVGVVSNLTNGSVNLLTGTVTSITNLAAGTVQINPDPVPTMLMFGTQGTAGGSFFGTLSAASGAGTKCFVSGVDIVVESGTVDVRILAGSAIQGTGVLAAGKFPPGGGIRKTITPAFETGTNSELVYHFVGAGTAFIHIDYWKGT